MDSLTILGSGTCVSSLNHPFDFRHPSGYLLQYKGKNIVIDCGEGIRFRLNHIEFDYFNVDTVVISHLHPDHFQLDAFLQGIFVRAKKTNVTKSIDVYGPSKIEEYFLKIWAMKHTDNFYETQVKPTLKITFHPFKEKQTEKITDDLSLTPVAVNHANMEAYALRFQLGKQVLTYSGDTSYCDGIIEAAKEATIFVCAAGENVGESSTNHMNPNQAGEAALKANAKQTYLTHLPAKNTADEIKADALKSGYKGELFVTNDYDVIPLSE